VTAWLFAQAAAKTNLRPRLPVGNNRVIVCREIPELCLPVPLEVYMKTNLKTVLAAAAITVSLLVSPHPHVKAEPPVIKVETIHVDLNGPIFQCSESEVGLCSAGTIASGLLKGSKEAVYHGFGASAGMPAVEPPTTLSYSGTSVFHTERGDLHTSFVGVLDTTRFVFTEISRVTSGSGRFTDATGNIFISGTVAADGTSFESTMTGEIETTRD
jgi:hypothetical protein